MSRKNRFHSSINQNGQPTVEEENMSEQENQQDQQEEVVTENPVEVTTQVPEQAPVVQEVKQEQPAPVQQPKVEVQKDPTTIEHTKLTGLSKIGLSTIRHFLLRLIIFFS